MRPGADVATRPVVRERHVAVVVAGLGSQRHSHASTGLDVTTIRRRTLLTTTLLATGLIPIGPIPAAAAPQDLGCRGWCLAHCDNTCRDTKRPACAARGA